MIWKSIKLVKTQESQRQTGFEFPALQLTTRFMFFGELLHYFVPQFPFQHNWDAYNSICHGVIVRTE